MDFFYDNMESRQTSQWPLEELQQKHDAKQSFYRTLSTFGLSFKIVKKGQKNLQRFSSQSEVVRAAASRFVVIGCVLMCLGVTFSRTVLIGQIGHVSYGGKMGSDTTAQAPLAA